MATGRMPTEIMPRMEGFPTSESATETSAAISGSPLVQSRNQGLTARFSKLTKG